MNVVCISWRLFSSFSRFCEWTLFRRLTGSGEQGVLAYSCWLPGSWKTHRFSSWWLLKDISGPNGAKKLKANIIRPLVQRALVRKSLVSHQRSRVEYLPANSKPQLGDLELWTTGRPYCGRQKICDRLQTQVFTATLLAEASKWEPVEASAFRAVRW